MLDYLNSLPESIAFMCTVVLRGYEVYIIGGRNDYGTINHFLSNDLPPKNIHHLLLTSEVMMGFRVSKINLRKNGFNKKILFSPSCLMLTFQSIILNARVKMCMMKKVFIYLFSFLMILFIRGSN